MRYFFSFLILLSGVSVLQAQWEAGIDSIFLEFKETPGCAVGVFKDGDIIFKKGYGIANLDYGVPITSETVFDIGSVSKQFTAACIVMLENEGKLSFDDDIRKFVPEMPEYEGGPITIRHLLHHTSGLRDYLTLMYLSGMSFNSYFTEEMGLDILIRQKDLNFLPGTEHLYSNSGYLILAIIIRRVSGMSIGEFAMNHIFKPLGMNQSLVYEDGSAVIIDRAIGYSYKGEKYVRDHHFDFVIGGDGQVYTTIEDFFKWSENYGENQLGDKTFIDKLLTKGVLANGDTLDYAMGIVHQNYKGHQAIGHSGSWGGFRTNYMRFPEEDVAIIVMCNLAGSNPMEKTFKIADLFLDMKIEKGEESTPETTQSESEMQEFSLDQIAGDYEIQPGMKATVSIKNDSLNVLQHWNNTSFILVRVDGNSFQIPGNDNLILTFLDLKNGYTQQLKASQGGVEMVSKRIRSTEVSEVDLKDYVGNYYSQELNVTYRITAKEKVLEVAIGYLDAVGLDVYGPDQFTSQGNLLQFNREEGEVSGFTLDAGRVTNLKFVKQ